MHPEYLTPQMIPQVQYDDRRMEYVFNEAFEKIIDQFYATPTLEVLRQIPIDILNKAFGSDNMVVLMDNIRVVAAYYKEHHVALLDVINDEYRALKIFIEAHDLLAIDHDTFIKKHMFVVDNSDMAEAILQIESISKETRKEVEAFFRKQYLIED